MKGLFVKNTEFGPVDFGICTYYAIKSESIPDGGVDLLVRCGVKDSDGNIVGLIPFSFASDGSDIDTQVENHISSIISKV